MHQFVTEMYTFLLQNGALRTWVWCLVGFVQRAYYAITMTLLRQCYDANFILPVSNINVCPLQISITFLVTCNVSQVKPWMAITSLTIVYSTVYPGADQRKHQSSASLAFVREIYWWPVNSAHKGPVMRKIVSIWWRHHTPPQQNTTKCEVCTYLWGCTVRGNFIKLGLQ